MKESSIPFEEEGNLTCPLELLSKLNPFPINPEPRRSTWPSSIAYLWTDISACVCIAQMKLDESYNPNVVTCCKIWSGNGIVSPSCRLSSWADDESINKVFVLGSNDNDGTLGDTLCTWLRELWCFIFVCCGYSTEGPTVELIPSPV